MAIDEHAQEVDRQRRPRRRDLRPPPAFGPRGAEAGAAPRRARLRLEDHERRAGPEGDALLTTEPVPGPDFGYSSMILGRASILGERGRPRVPFLESRLLAGG